MVEILKFFQQYEAVVYFILGIGVIYYGWRFWTSWLEVRSAIYGLEQQSAQLRLNQSAISIFALVGMGFIVFSLVTFIAPVVAPEIVLPIATFDVNSLSPQSTIFPEEELAVEGEPLSTALPTVQVDEEACVVGRVEITSPEGGSSLQGEVNIEGTADIPNFGYYKFEIARSQEELWRTIRAGRNPIKDNYLMEDWDTSLFPPGDYVIQLVVTDNEGTEEPKCRIPVRIEPAP